MNTTENEDCLPYDVSRVICTKCGKIWVATRPSGAVVKELECPKCGQVKQTEEYLAFRAKREDGRNGRTID